MKSYWGVDHGDEEVSKALLPASGAKVKAAGRLTRTKARSGAQTARNVGAGARQIAGNPNMNPFARGAAGTRGVPRTPQQNFARQMRIGTIAAGGTGLGIGAAGGAATAMGNRRRNS